MSEDARQLSREPALKGALIRVPGVGSPMACLITNLSDDGAELTLDADARLPAHFTVEIPHEGATWRVSVRWREPGRIGVGFDSRQVSNRPHLRAV